MSARPAVSFVIGMAKKKDSVEITKEEALSSAGLGQAEDDGAKDEGQDKQKVQTSLIKGQQDYVDSTENN
jgi:hypothetical protein